MSSLPNIFFYFNIYDAFIEIEARILLKIYSKHPKMRLLL